MSERKLVPVLGSRLQLISQTTEEVTIISDHLEYDGKVKRVPIWRVWTAVNNPNLPPEKRLGTFIELRADGSAWTVHVTADGYNEFECMEKL